MTSPFVTTCDPFASKNRHCTLVDDTVDVSETIEGEMRGPVVSDDEFTVNRPKSEVPLTSESQKKSISLSHDQNIFCIFFHKFSRDKIQPIDDIFHKKTRFIFMNKSIKQSHKNTKKQLAINRFVGHF